MSRVLKDTGGKVIAGEVFDARAEAERLLAEARAAAAAIEAQARRDGQAAGREEGLAAVTELLARARAAAARREEEAEPELRRLAVRIAEKLLGRELAADPGAVVDVVRQALAAARSRRELTVRVHPEDVAAVTAARPRLGEALARHAEIAVRADDGVARGGCLIDTEVGTIDARLEVQLAAIERALCGD